MAASCAWTAFSRASKARAIGRVNHRIRDQLLGDLAEHLLALPGEPVDEALVLLGGRHRAAGYINATLRTDRFLTTQLELYISLIPAPWKEQSCHPDGA